MSRKLSVHKTSWPMIAPFRITGHVFEVIDMIEVEVIYVIDGMMK